MRVLVTGASGFLGGKIVEALVGQGLQVRALVRTTSSLENLKKLPVEVIEGSLNPPNNLMTALEGVDVLIHSAGGGWYKNKYSMCENNTQTTQNILDAWGKIGCSGKKIILISSQAAGGPAINAEHHPKEHENNPRSLYGKSKLAAEKIVLQFKEKMSVVVLRPPALYGPGDRRMLPLFKAARRGLIPMPASGQTMSFLHVDDCVAAVCLVLKHGPMRKHVYAINDGICYCADDVVRALGQAVDKKTRLIRVPDGLLFVAGLCSEWWGGIRGKPVLLSRDKVCDMVGAYWQSDVQDFVQDYHWQPSYEFADGATQTALWYRQVGWLAN